MLMRKYVLDRLILLLLNLNTGYADTMFQNDVIVLLNP